MPNKVIEIYVDTDSCEVTNIRVKKSFLCSTDIFQQSRVLIKLSEMFENMLEELWDKNQASIKKAAAKAIVTLKEPALIQ